MTYPFEMAHQGLDRLNYAVRTDLAKIAHPAMSWLEPTTAPDGGPALDVVIVGAGQCGLATAFGLMRSCVTNILVIDKASRDREGPWRTYARMPALRSPKTFTGPDLDIPSLTYQSWHEACFGQQNWDGLDLIPKDLWARYLLWYREILGIPVENEVELIDIAPAGAGLLAVTVRPADASRKTLFTRKLVLATGQESMGGWALPPPLDQLPPRLRARAADPINFAALAGKSVIVTGAGASAFDNAATALESGVANVTLLCRRPEPQVIQPYRWLTFRGFLRHFADLDDIWRWRFMNMILSLREGFPQATYDRCAKHSNFTMLTGASVVAAAEADGRARLETAVGRLDADFVIAAAGIEMNFCLRPELARFHENIATWADRYSPPEGEYNERLARFPYLGDDYAFEERRPGSTPWIRDIHVFSMASTMSFGASGSSINAMTTAVPMLVAGITRGLFLRDIDRHWTSLSTYDVPQAIVGRAPPCV